MSFKSVLKKIAEDVEHFFENPVVQEGIKVAETVVSLAVPALGPLFNMTANAVLTAEANFAAIGKSAGTGEQKLAAVVANVGNLVEQGLKDAGVSSVDQAKVAGYISSVVTVLNGTPAPAGA